MGATPLTLWLAVSSSDSRPRSRTRILWPTRWSMTSSAASRGLRTRSKRFGSWRPNLRQAGRQLSRASLNSLDSPRGSLSRRWSPWFMPGTATRAGWRNRSRLEGPSRGRIRPGRSSSSPVSQCVAGGDFQTCPGAPRCLPPRVDDGAPTLQSQLPDPLATARRISGRPAMSLS